MVLLLTKRRWIMLTNIIIAQMITGSVSCILCAVFMAIGTVYVKGFGRQRGWSKRKQCVFMCLLAGTIFAAVFPIAWYAGYAYWFYSR